MKKYVQFFKFLKNKKKIQTRYNLGESIDKDYYYSNANKLSNIEMNNIIFRFDIINFLLSTLNRKTKYLEIGVRTPEDNFNKIKSEVKYSVDPGFENKENPVDFKITSDVFFKKLDNGDILDKDVKFDVIFIDGLHLANQVERDIKNALNYLKKDGFIVLHDCNPPTEYHARENFDFKLSPAKEYWNGTTWKAFFKARQSENLFSCCINADWGIGVISKTKKIGKKTTTENPFFEFEVFSNNRKESLNLILFNEFKDMFI